MPVGNELEQQLEHFRGCAASLWRLFRLGEFRQLVLGCLKYPVDQCQEFLGIAVLVEAARKSAGAVDVVHVARRMPGDFVDRLVLENAPAWHVVALCLFLAPLGYALHEQQFTRLAHAQLEPLPRIFRQHLVCFARGKNLHLLGHPLGPVLLFKICLQGAVDRAQMGHVGDRVVQLLVGQGPALPVGETRGFVDMIAGDLENELIVGNRVAEATDHRRNLSVEHRVRYQPAKLEDDFDILPRRVENLDDSLVAHQFEEWCEIDAFGQRINDEGIFSIDLDGAGYLDEAQFRPEGRFSKKLGIDCHKIAIGYFAADLGQFGGFCDDAHVLTFLAEPSSGSLAAGTVACASSRTGRTDQIFTNSSHAWKACTAAIL